MSKKCCGKWVKKNKYCSKCPLNKNSVQDEKKSLYEIEENNKNKKENKKDKSKKIRKSLKK
jgi:hypothetical protein